MAETPERALAWPIRWTASGQLAEVTVGSPVEKGQQVDLVVGTETGDFRAFPAFGHPPLLWGQGEQAAEDAANALDAAITEWAPDGAAAIIDYDESGVLGVDVRGLADDTTDGAPE